MKERKIVLGVCGSVAAVETVKLVRELMRNNVSVECVMSKSAKKIINSNVLEWASEKPVITKITGMVEHVRLCGVNGEASLLLICPATSNTISKIACGIDDTTVTTFAATALGAGKKIIIAPAMHYSMYHNPFIKENIERLKKHKIKFIEPKIEENKAKLATNKDIVEFVLKELG